MSYFAFTSLQATEDSRSWLLLNFERLFSTHFLCRWGKKLSNPTSLAVHCTRQALGQFLHQPTSHYQSFWFSKPLAVIPLSVSPLLWESYFVDSSWVATGASPSHFPHFHLFSLLLKGHVPLCKSLIFLSTKLRIMWDLWWISSMKTLLHVRSKYMAIPLISSRAPFCSV